MVRGRSAFLGKQKAAPRSSSESPAETSLKQISGQEDKTLADAICEAVSDAVDATTLFLGSLVGHQQPQVSPQQPQIYHGVNARRVGGSGLVWA